MKEKYQSDLLEAIHETAKGLHKIRVIDDKEMREYDEDCLVQEPKTDHDAERSLEVAHVTV